MEPIVRLHKYGHVRAIVTLAAQACLRPACSAFVARPKAADKMPGSKRRPEPPIFKHLLKSGRGGQPLAVNCRKEPDAVLF
jgi:hypothetical protein